METETKLRKFWEDKITKEFYQKSPSDYIVNIFNKIDNSATILDIGCGAGRYLNYLDKKGYKNLVGVDYSKKMLSYINSPNIKTLNADMKNIPLQCKYDVVLSIGVLHNVNNLKEFELAVSEISRLLKNGGMCICSVFTNDIITSDLYFVKDNLYLIEKETPVYLLDKKSLVNIFAANNLIIDKIIDEHITKVSTIGERNVYTFILKHSEV